MQTAVRCLPLSGGQSVKFLVGSHKRTHRRQHLTHIGRQGSGVERFPSSLHHVEQCRSRTLVVLLLFQSSLGVLYIEVAREEINLRLSSVVVGLEDSVEVVLIEPAQSRCYIYCIISIL